jgi:serine/threonine-protein kinase
VSARQFGNYTLLATIATGGMAEVLLARMHGAAGFAKLVVIKRLIDRLAGERQYVDMFLDEAKIAARLSHSNIVQVLELGETDGRYFIAMEFLAGLNLSTLAKKAAQRTGGMPADLTAVLIAQACAGMHYAHERCLPDGRPLAIVHRDISPHNLVVTFEGLVKIVDFGIAKAEDRLTTTATGLVKGKFAYMSPEQCLGDPLDRRSDVFTLGIVLWETLTGRRLFRRRSTYETYEAILKDTIRPPSAMVREIDPEFDRITLRALERTASKRYQTAEALQDDLEEQLHRRAALGSSAFLTRLDVAGYLERHFEPEIRSQREFLQRVDRGELEGPAPVAEAYPPLVDDSEAEEARTTVFQSADRPDAASGGGSTMHASAPPPGEAREYVLGEAVQVMPVGRAQVGGSDRDWVPVVGGEEGAGPRVGPEPGRALAARGTGGTTTPSVDEATPHDVTPVTSRPPPPDELTEVTPSPHGFDDITQPGGPRGQEARAGDTARISKEAFGHPGVWWLWLLTAALAGGAVAWLLRR